ncbi:Arginine/lysine/ornithine decarboxylase [Ruminococcaceae bacterium YRB3002]|nr:Arginine/lysine/ornithine decarboxylase [Ruminococcaceae bacterium YRB3002]
MSNRYLHRELRKYCESDILPMHMPGGKRRVGLLPGNDITEITGFDNLHAPSGIIKELESGLASLWHAQEAFLSVNGATAMIGAAICAAMRYYPGGKVLAASNCHLSVWHAIEMTGCMHAVVDPVTEPGIPFALEISPESIETALASDPSIKTVVITSPTYEGVISDTKTICSIARKYGCTLITDSAHGAHLGLDEYWGEDAEGDLVIKSTHKTLSSPTQTAVMLKYSERVRTEDIRHYVDIFESSSPSYVLMSGVSEMVEFLHSPDALKDWKDGVVFAGQELSKLQNIRVFSCDRKDPSKFVFICNGTALADILRTDYRIEAESSNSASMIAMTGIGDNRETLGRFASAMLAIDRDHPGLALSSPVSCRLPEHDIVMSLQKASRCVPERIDISEAEGRTAAEYIYSYPPGIPVILPGDRISRAQMMMTDGSVSVHAEKE